MKKLLLAVLLAGSVLSSQAQTTSTNFTANDCNGNPHELFADLDAGKVVVIVWVMPCGACVGPAKAAYNAASSFSSSHPGLVKYILVDDYANTSCANLGSWATSNSIFADAMFSTGSISMSDYGTDGMPKVVVTAGANRKIFYNVNDAAADNSTAIQAAINHGLNVMNVQKTAAQPERLKVYPNPVLDRQLNISFFNSAVNDVKIELINMTGVKVYSQTHLKQAAGAQNYEIQLGEIPKGVYFVNVNGLYQKLSVL